MKSVILCTDPSEIETVAFELISDIKGPIYTNIEQLKDVDDDIHYTTVFPLEAETIVWVKFSTSQRLLNRINDIQANMYLLPNDLVNIIGLPLQNKDVKLYEVKTSALPESPKTVQDVLNARRRLACS